MEQPVGAAFTLCRIDPDDPNLRPLEAPLREIFLMEINWKSLECPSCRRKVPHSRFRRLHINSCIQTCRNTHKFTRHVDANKDTYPSTPTTYTHTTRGLVLTPPNSRHGPSDSSKPIPEPYPLWLCAAWISPDFHHCLSESRPLSMCMSSLSQQPRSFWRAETEECPEGERV